MKPYVERVRALAVCLGKKGPLTVEDLLDKAEKKGLLEDAPDHRRWTSGLFPDKLWIRLGDVYTTREVVHARRITLWALRSWLKNNSVNGSGLHESSFNIPKILTAFRSAYADTPDEDLVWLLGTNAISTDYYTSKTKQLFNIDIVAVPGIGAALTFKSNLEGVKI